VAAVVMEPSDRSPARCYARIRAGRSAAGGRPAALIAQMLGDSMPALTVCSGNGAPCAPSSTAALAREISGESAVIIPPQPFAAGLAGTGAVFHLILALSSGPMKGEGLLLGTAGGSGFAALALELT
jgi:hypothetical protein